MAETAQIRVMICDDHVLFRRGLVMMLDPRVLTEFARLSEREAAEPPRDAPRLTERELEVLQLVAEGMSNRELAEKLYIAENTAKNHVRNILEKLHSHTRTEAVMCAVRERILDIA